MKANLGLSLELLGVSEGGLSDHAADPGGLTNMGVTHSVYDAWRRVKGLRPQNVRLITAAEVRDIFTMNYWHPIQGDELPGGIDYAVFDGAVNSGVQQSVKWLQRSLNDVGFASDGTGALVDDGIVGIKTIAATLRVKRPALIENMIARRLLFLKRARGGSLWKAFGVGWAKRLESVRYSALSSKF